MISAFVFCVPSEPVWTSDSTRREILSTVCNEVTSVNTDGNKNGFYPFFWKCRKSSDFWFSFFKVIQTFLYKLFLKCKTLFWGISRLFHGCIAYISDLFFLQESLYLCITTHLKPLILLCFYGDTKGDTKVIQSFSCIKKVIQTFYFVSLLVSYRKSSCFYKSSLPSVSCLKQSFILFHTVYFPDNLFNFHLL